MATSLASEWTNYGPIPTLFTPPSKCNHLTLRYPTVTTKPEVTSGVVLTNSTAVRPQLIYFDPVLAPECYPPEYSTVFQSPTTTGPSASPLQTEGFFYPARCPSDWSIYTLDYSFIPANYTLAACCPLLPSSTLTGTGLSEATKQARDLNRRKGSRPKKHTLTGCRLNLPPPTPAVKTDIRSADEDIPSSTPFVLYPTAQGREGNTIPTVTELSPDQQLTLLGTRSSDLVIHATGFNVMWKAGDFPDLEASVSASRASVSASNAAFYHHDNYGTKSRLGLGGIVGIVGGVLIFVVFTTVGILLIWRHRMHRNGHTMTFSFHGWLRRRFSRGSSASGIGSGKGRGSGEHGGLLGHESSEQSNTTRRFRGPGLSPAVDIGGHDLDDIPSINIGKVRGGEDEETPPPYSQASPSTNATRQDSETDLEYEQRRLRERKEILMERIRLQREEEALRARMRDNRP